MGGVSILRVIADFLAAEMQGDEGYIADFSGQLDGNLLRLVALGKKDVISGRKIEGASGADYLRHSTVGKIVSSHLGILLFCILTTNAARAMIPLILNAVFIHYIATKTIMLS